MSETSLRDYLAKLDNLLNANAADEVIHHCRHILQYFPKNVAAYRYLGRALVENGRWDEAGAALQRVLSVIPDDFIAHVGLSEATERSNRPDDAIWHLERAFEQQPADKTILEQLRLLYRRYRGVENAKIPLTAVAVARQAQKNSAYAQAADTLRGALHRSPQRVDLRLLLAEVLWDADQRLEAAELAMDVLEKLPDCLSANRIMTGLWLSEGRPTDAQRYINHLEAVDPYLAVELVTAKPVDDHAFRLDELDFRRSAQSEVAADRPDWLQDIGATSGVVASPAPGEQLVPADDQWDQWVSAMLQGTPKPAEKPPMSGDEWLNAQDSLLDSGTLNTFEVTHTGELEEIDALFQTDSLGMPASSGLDADDPVAWLRDAGIEIQAEDDNPGTGALLFDGEEEFQAPEAEDPLAWMAGYDLDVAESGDESPATSDEEVPDWMMAVGDDAAAPVAATSDTDLDWLSAADLDAPDTTSPGEDFSWMTLDDGGAADLPAPSDPVTQPMKDLPQGVPGAKRGLTAMLSETTFDWNETAQSDAADDSWMAEFGGASTPAAAATSEPDWLTALDSADELALPDTGALGWGEEVSQSGGDEMTDNTAGNDADDGFSWMSEFDDLTASSGDSPTVNPDMPDWLSELEPSKDEPAAKPEPSTENDRGWTSSIGEGEAEDDDFDWLEESAAEDDAVSDVPDWLAEAEPDSMQLSDSSADANAADDFDWMSGMELGDDQPAVEADAVSETPDWLSELEPKAETPVEAGTVPDWLSEMEPEPETPAAVTVGDDLNWMSALDEDEPEAEGEAEAVSATPDWLSELEPEVETPVEAGTVPDWLSEIEPEPETPAAVTVGDDLNWMSALDEDEPEAEGEVEAVSATPDWLSELEPEAEMPAAVTGADDLNWMSALDEDEPEAEGEAEAVSATPDWLSELEPEAETPVEAGTVPDWLTEMEPEAETPAAESVADDLNWMSALDEDEPEAEGEAEAVSATPDWLSELEPEAETPAVESVADDLNWMSALDEDEPEAEAVSATPDWLSELEPEAETPAAAASGSDAFDMPLSEAEALAAPETSADAEIDWISDLEPVESDAVPAEEFASMLEAEPGAEALPAAPETADVVAVDEILPHSEDTEVAPPEPIPAPVDDLLPLMAEDEGEIVAGVSSEADGITEPDSFVTEADNAPDWLNAMVPGLDVDYAPTDEAVEELPEVEEASPREFAWLSNIVEEETADTAAVKFAFTKAPAWLERLMPPSPPAAPPSDADFPDWVSDDDADLPEWLR